MTEARGGTRSLEVAIVGGGIAGLALAMNLHAKGISARVYERAPEIKELGVGITLLPHAMREFTALGIADQLIAAGIENLESCFYNRFGQLIYKEPRGKYAGYKLPEVGIHRGKLHMILYQAAKARLGQDAQGADRIRTNAACMGVEQSAGSVKVLLQEATSGKPLPPVTADVVVACDGINSAVRRQFYPADRLAFAGINTWRGVTRRKPFLTGRSYLRVGSIRTGKMVIYPIVNDIDGQGNQLINWMAEIEDERAGMNDWNKPGQLEDFLPIYKDWRFDWLDVAQMVRDAEAIYEYPMVDKDPVERWTFDRVTLAGDAAHPMYPRGSNGAAQAAVDARVLADLLAANEDPRAALRAYEARRLPAANRVVTTNRANPPDFINIKVEELVGDRPFDNLDAFITQAELKELSDQYKRIAGFALEDVGAADRR